MRTSEASLSPRDRGLWGRGYRTERLHQDLFDATFATVPAYLSILNKVAGPDVPQSASAPRRAREVRDARSHPQHADLLLRGAAVSHGAAQPFARELYRRSPPTPAPRAPSPRAPRRARSGRPRPPPASTTAPPRASRTRDSGRRPSRRSNPDPARRPGRDEPEPERGSSAAFSSPAIGALFGTVRPLVSEKKNGRRARRSGVAHTKRRRTPSRLSARGEPSKAANASARRAAEAADSARPRRSLGSAPSWSSPARRAAAAGAAYRDASAADARKPPASGALHRRPRSRIVASAYEVEGPLRLRQSTTSAPGRVRVGGRAARSPGLMMMTSAATP